MRHFISLLAGIICLLAANSATAGPLELQATHSIVSTQATATGNAVMLDITITNTVGDLDGINLVLIDNDLNAAGAAQDLFIPALAAGESTTLSWTLELQDTELLPDDVITIGGSATDQDGEKIKIEFESEGM